MLFPWLREREREKLIAAPFPEEWLPHLERNVGHYRYLSPDEQARLRDDLRVFRAEKHWEGCGGLALTDEIEVTIAAQACLLTLCLPHDFYPNVKSILVYPAMYAARREEQNPDGSVTEVHDARLGEAWHIGAVVLSWQDVRHGGAVPDDGHNVVLHEFAHQLDMRDGRVDGVPRLHDDAAYDRWAEVMSAEYALLVEQSERSRATVLDQYGAENAGEFFAVATEAFFEKPLPMRHHHPRLYELMRDYYGQDPAARVGHGCGEHLGTTSSA